MSSFDIARRSLEANIMTLPSGSFLTAGQNQFQTLWTRDFCHAVRGLLVIGKSDVARNHLEFLLANLREDGLVPRVVDNHLVQLRVAWQAGRKILPFLPRLSFHEPLKPQYTDEHGSNAFDSNVLLILACLQLDNHFWKAHEDHLKKTWAWYEDKFQDGLINQSSFADWQDTTKREGQTFLLNLFYYLAAARLKDKGWKVLDLEAYKQKIQRTFFLDGLFISQVGYPQISVEGNLFSLEASEFLTPNEKNLLWEKLKSHQLVSLDGAIGRCSYPDWPTVDLAWHVRLANLQRYHGSLTWSWLLGLGLKVAKVMGDDEMVKKQTSHIERLLTRDGEVYEVYDPDNDFKPWGSWLIKSEHPFAWGAGYLVDALKASS